MLYRSHRRYKHGKIKEMRNMYMVIRILYSLNLIQKHWKENLLEDKKH